MSALVKGAVALFLAQQASLGLTQEITLFDGAGQATAYIDVSDDLTIYLWSGKPVAYLDKSGSEFLVYGFNGKHLGWFEGGVIWDHRGYGACAVEKSLRRIPSIEPIKSIKQIAPIRSVQQIAPVQPILQSSFGSVPCSVLLSSGR